MPGQAVDTLRYAIDGDLAPFKAKAAQVDAEASRLGDSVKAKTAHAFDGATAGASKLSNQLKLTANQYQAFAREAATTGKSVESLIAAHFRAGAAAEAASKKTVAALATEQVARRAALNQARAAAEQTARLAARASPNAIPLRDYQKINLGQQVQDFFISMGSGQNPLTVILQQAPQAASAAGGVSNAFKLLGGAAGVARIAIGGLVGGGLGAFIAASVHASDASARIQRALAATGNAAGVTRREIGAMAEELDRRTHFSTATAEKTLTTLASRGNIRGPMLPQVGELVADFSRVTGTKPDESAAYFAEILAEPKRAAKELHEQFNLLTSAQVREIDTLVNSGEAQKALALLVRESATRFDDANTSATTLAEGLGQAASAAANFWRWLGGGGGGMSDEARAALYRQRAMRKPEGSQGRADDLAEAARIEAGLERNAENSRRAPHVAALDAASGLGARWNPEEEERRRRAEDGANLTQGRAAAVALKDWSAVASIDRQLANLNNPDFRPGSGVPQGRRAGAQRVDTGARDAQLAEMEVANARALAATPLRDREALRARQQAEAEFTRNSADPRRRGNAASIRDSRNEAFEVNQADRRRQVVVAVQEEVTAQQKLAEAYLRSTAAGAAQVTQGQAHAAAIQGLIENEDEYARVLNERAFAQAQVNDAQAQQQRALGNQALARLAAANGSPAGLEAARIENDALSQTQALRDEAAALQLRAETTGSIEDRAKATEALAAAEMALNAARRQGKEAAGYDRQMVQAANDNRARESIELREAEVRLAYANAEALAMETAAIRAYHQAVGEKEVPGTDSFARRYQQILALNREAAQLELILSGQDKNTQVIDNVRAGLEDIGMAATRGFDSARDAASSFFRQLGDLIVQLYVIQPLLNGLMGTEKGTVGGLFGSIGRSAQGGGGGGNFWATAANAVMSFFGGPREAGGPTSPGQFYLVGEKGPELFAPGVAGNVIPLKPPSSQSVQSTAPSAPQAMTMAFTIDISGANGDAAVAAIARQATAEGVTAALTAYDASLNRGIGAKLQQANSRRIR